MSDMSHVYNAYAAVHNSEKRNNLSEVRDQISEMTLTQLTDIDLYEVAEEVLEEVFSNGTSVAEAQELIESVFKKAAEGDVSPVRADKVERLGEAFATAFEKVKERSLRTAVESYSEYRRNKERLEKWNDSNSTGSVNQKLHDRLVGEDRLVVKTGLKTMIEAASPAAQEEKLRKDDKLFGSPNTYETKKRAEVLGALKKRDLDKKTKEKIAADIVKKKGDTSKSDDRYAYESATPESGTGKYYVQGQPTAQQKKNAASRAEIRKLTNQGRHKEASALHAQITKTSKEEFELVDKLVESGKFSGVEIAKIADIQEADIADIIARLEKKRISKGGDPKESPLPAMRDYHADKTDKKNKKK